MHIKRLLTPIAVWFTGTLLIAGPVTFESGENATNLIELFTSEGCSSCPPADAWVSRLKSSPALWRDVVPVVFHVDYWDGLGWADRFATAPNTKRQRSYAAVWRTSSVYTPGFVLNGREWRDWSPRAALPARSSAKAGKLAVALGETHADVIFTPVGTVPKSLQVEIAFLGGDLASDVKRGENSGRKLQHDFTVLHHSSKPLRSDGGKWAATVQLPAKAADTPKAIAAWITAGDAQPPIQATGGWLTNTRP